MSDKVRNKIINTVNKSSSDHYQVLWKQFINFIATNNKVLSIYSVLEFFSMKIDNGLALQSLRMYRSALKRPILELLHVNILENNWVVYMFDYAKTHLKKSSPYFPSWDVEKVLKYLNSSSFFQQCQTDKSLRMRADFFLLLLASPTRISECQAASLSNSFVNSEGILLLKTHGKFLPKNHSATFKPKPIRIPKNIRFPRLCPVLAYQRYISFSHELCMNLNISRPDALWLNSKGCKASLKQLRFWFRDIIFRADPNAKFNNTKFHSIRKVAAAQLYDQGGIDLVLEKMNWKSKSTYFRYYASLGPATDLMGVVGGCSPQLHNR